MSYNFFLITLPFITVCTSPLFKGTVIQCSFSSFSPTVCPVPMNKEQEEMIKEQERNKEEMEEVMREIEITCLGELIK